MIRTDTSNCNVAELLLQSARNQEDRPALIGPDGSVLWTFPGLLEAGQRLAGGLRERGVGPGDVVAALVADPADFVLLATSVMWAGAALAVPPRAGGWRQKLAAVAALQPRVVVSTLRLWPLVATEPALRSAGLRLCTGRWTPPGTARLRDLGHAVPIAPVRVDADQPAVVSFTTGTTGAPKAVTRTHGVLRGQRAALAALRPPRSDDVDLVGLPLLVLHNLAAGVPSVIPPPPTAPAHSLSAVVQRVGVTAAAGFPPLIERLAAEGTADTLRSLRTIHVGGAYARPDLLQRMAQAAPQAEVTIVYGCTEAEPISAIGYEAYLHAHGQSADGVGICVGRPVESVEIRIAPLNLTECSAARWQGWEVGRVLVSGGNVAGGDRWLDTGDVGYMDDEGRLWLMGRAANVGPGQLFPATVEPVIAALPWVQRAALVVQIDGQVGSSVLAIEPVRRTAGPERTRRLAEAHALANARGWPIARIELLDRLPTGRLTSKVDYPRLARMLIDFPQRP